MFSPFVPNKLDSSLSQNQSLNKQPYVMNGTKGFCFVCSLELTSQQHCNQHITGRQHLKKEKELASRAAHSLNENNTPVQSMSQVTERLSGQDYVLNDSGGKCFVCDVLFTSKALGIQHLAGQKHKKKIENTAAYSPSPQVSPLSSHFSSSLASKLFPVIPRAVAPPAYLSQPAGPNGEAYIMNGTKGYCYVCRLELTSTEHASSHLNGTKHRKKCGADNGSSMSTSLTNGKVLMCKICRVPFSCIKNAEEHFQSDKHKKRVAEAEKDYSNDPEQTVVMRPFPCLRSGCLNTDDKSLNAIRQNMSEAIGYSVDTREVPSPQMACSDRRYFLPTERNVQVSSSGPIMNPVELCELLDVINTNETAPSSEEMDVLHGATIDLSLTRQASSLSRELNETNSQVDLPDAHAMEGKSLNRAGLPSNRNELKTSLNQNMYDPDNLGIQSSTDQTTHMNTQSITNSSNGDIKDVISDKKYNVENFNEPCQEFNKLKIKTFEGDSELFSFEKDTQFCSSMIDNTKQKGYDEPQLLASMNYHAQTTKLTITQTSHSTVKPDSKQQKSCNTISDSQVLPGSRACDNDQSFSNTAGQSDLLADRTESLQQIADLPAIPDTSRTGDNQSQCYQSTAPVTSAPNSSSSAPTQRQNPGRTLYFMPTTQNQEGMTSQHQEDMTTLHNSDHPVSSAEQRNDFIIHPKVDNERKYMNKDKQLKKENSMSREQSCDQKPADEITSMSINEPVDIDGSFRETVSSLEINQVASLKVENRSSDLIQLEAAVTNLQINEASSQGIFKSEHKSIGSESEEKYYYFDGSRGFCHACSIELTSFQHANQHLNGQKHQKKMQQMHFTQYLQNETRSPLSAPVVTEIHTAPSLPKETYFIFDGCKGMCHACSIELTSTQHARQHISGKPHRRNVERLKLLQQGIAYPNYCDVCKKGFTGAESAVQHFTSSRHKSKAELLEMSQVRSYQGDRVVVKDGVTWYLCEVCECLSNSKEQLIKHSETLKHRELEASFNHRLLLQGHSVPEPRDNIMHSSGLSERGVKTNEATQESILADNRQHLTYGEIPKISLDRASPPIIKYTNPSPVSVNVYQEGSPNFTQISGRPILGANAAINYSSSMGSMTTPVFATHMSPNSSDGSAPYVVGAIGSRIQSSQLDEGSRPTGSLTTSALANDMLLNLSVGSAPNFGVIGSRIQSSQLDEGSRPTGPVTTSGLANNMLLNLSVCSSPNFGAIGGSSHQGMATSDLACRDSTDSSSDSFGAVGKKTHNPNNSSSFGNGNAESRSNALVEQTPLDQAEGGASGTFFRNNPEDSDDDGSSISRRGGSEYMKNPGKVKHSKNRGGEKGMISFDRRESEQDDNEDDHFESLEERQNFNIQEELVKLKTPETPPERSTKPGFKYFCRICDKHMNTLANYNAHIVGNSHLYISSLQKSPVRQLEPIRKSDFPYISNYQDLLVRACKCIKDLPRAYQGELLQKTISGNYIVYLPTGTGKTLVAVMTIALMLEENPLRPVLFLVDKVLLVLQQAKYIKEQLHEKKFNRFNVDRQPVKREIFIKAICGGLSSKSDRPIWNYDIVVTTAAFCENMLQRGLIRWEDFSLIVLDEVHHCNKLHPYLKLLDTHHNKLPPESRPKILGLTASPAGKSTVQETYQMLQGLLKNLGGAKIAVVENEKANLDLYQSSAEVHPICVPLSSKERELRRHLLEYIVLCYSRFASVSSLKNIMKTPCSYLSEAVKYPTDRQVSTMIAERFLHDDEPLADLIGEISSASCVNEKRQILFNLLKIHLMKLLLTLSEVGTGADFVNELDSILKPSNNVKEFEQLGLPCKEIHDRILKFSTDGNADLTMFNKLIETLQDISYINWDDKSCKALILVRERKLARQLSQKLRENKLIQDKMLRVTHLVGHGTGAQDYGMDVKKQKRVLDNQEKYNIVVATSIMEEGIDFQSLQLVVSMNPPTSLRALVQIRGRARRKGSHFVILCSSEEEVEKLNRLKVQEKNMQAAAQLCIEEETN